MRSSDASMSVQGRSRHAAYSELTNLGAPTVIRNVSLFSSHHTFIRHLLVNSLEHHAGNLTATTIDTLMLGGVFYCALSWWIACQSRCNLERKQMSSTNIKTAFSVNFDHWSAGSSRKAFEQLLGHSIFMSDGAEWSRARGKLRPTFAKDRIADLELFEAHFQKLLKLIPKNGATVDLNGLSQRFAFDVSSEFLSGESLDSLEDQTDSKAQLAHDIEPSIQDAVDRARWSLLCRWLKRPGVDRAIRYVHVATTAYVQATLERASEDQLEVVMEGARYSLLDEMARQTQDAMKMRDDATTLMFSGKDTIAGLLGSM